MPDAPRRGRRPVLWISGIVLVALVVGAGVALAAGPGGSAYRTAAVVRGTVTSTVNATGTIAPVNQAILSFPVAGTVATLSAAVGQHVTVGQHLAQLDLTSLQAQLASAQATLATAQNRLASDESGQSSGAAVPAAFVTSSLATSAGVVVDTAFTGSLADLQAQLVADQHAADVALGRAKNELASETATCAALSAAAAGGAHRASAAAAPSGSASAGASSSGGAGSGASSSGGGSGGAGSGGAGSGGAGSGGAGSASAGSGRGASGGAGSASAVSGRGASGGAGSASAVSGRGVAGGAGPGGAASASAASARGVSGGASAGGSAPKVIDPAACQAAIGDVLAQQQTVAQDQQAVATDEAALDAALAAKAPASAAPTTSPSPSSPSPAPSRSPGRPAAPSPSANPFAPAGPAPATGGRTPRGTPATTPSPAAQGAGAGGHGAGTPAAGSRSGPSASAAAAGRAAAKAGGGSGGGARSGNASGGGSSAPVTAEQLAADQATIDADDDAIDVAQQALDQASLVSPLDGTVGSVTLSAGQSVTAGSSTARIVVIGPGSDQVSTTVSDLDVGAIRVGAAATVTPSGGAAPLTGNVVSVGLLDTATGTAPAYPVVIGLSGTTPPLADGQGAAVSIVTAQVADTVAVPSSAVHTVGANHFVTVLNGGSPTNASVQVGAVGPALTQITSGLNPGDQVVLADLDQPLPTATTGLRGVGGGGRAGGGG